MYTAWIFSPIFIEFQALVMEDFSFTKTLLPNISENAPTNRNSEENKKKFQLIEIYKNAFLVIEN